MESRCIWWDRWMWKGTPLNLQNSPTTTKTQTINNKHADAILSNRATYVHALSPVKRVFG